MIVAETASTGTVYSMDVAYASAPPQGELVQATATNRAHLSRLARRGAAQRLAPGLYAVGAVLPPENVVTLHRHAIVGLVWPGAVLRGRSALSALVNDPWVG
jgi:predicted transcriptional regulator of viral defense system